MVQGEVVQQPDQGVLAGAIDVAIERAERFKTQLVIMENGRIIHVSPQEMRERLAKR